ncbi:MAG: insulinase family protein [Candidatus Omnitrophica bacterium]|nr:insulinase family protein [Candidatus Omnitrophota bacterium]
MYKIKKLRNGFKIITSEMPHMDSIAVGLWIGVGSRYETKRLCGISHLAEHMLFKGTHTRSASALKEAIEGKGGSFNGFTTEEMTCFLVKMPANYMELGFDILSDMVRNPALDERELEKEKYVIGEEIKMYRDQPAQHVFDILSEEMWPGEALGRPILGYEKTVKSFKRKDLISFMGRYYSPENIACVACGKINQKKLYSAAQNLFSRSGRAKREGLSYKRLTRKGKSLTVFRKKTEQAHLTLGFHSINRSHKARYAIALLHIILGGNMSSRLFDRLREEKALCYDISTAVKKYSDTGAFVIHAGIANDKMLDASEEIIKELEEIRKNLVMPDELERAKEYAKGQLLLALEDTGSRMVWLGEKIMTEGAALPIRELLRNIEKVSAEDVRKTANIVFCNNNLNFAAIGRAQKGVRKKLKGILNL